MLFLDENDEILNRYPSKQNFSVFKNKNFKIIYLNIYLEDILKSTFFKQINSS